MVHAFSLGAALGILWLLLSGHYDPLMLGLGFLSICGALVVAHRMAVVDHESVPLQLRLRGLRYWPWLAKEIAKANWDVTRIVLSRSGRGTPTLLWLESAQRSDLGQVIYANSITLTPGTISVVVERDRILVHALTREMAAGLETGEMHDRVRALEVPG
jgi:multicomponent Na+:H+ antiporter subunit E